MPPIHLSTTFRRADDGTYPGGYEYVRDNNPNRQELEECLAALEGGATAIATPSGMAATHAVFSALEPGDRVVVPRDTYFGTSHLLQTHFTRWGLEVVTADLTDAEGLQDVIRPGTRLVWIETPSNPCIAVTDIVRVVEAARRAGALVACDNTWATPILQRPLELGADVVVHSTTKYMAGHSDTMGGAVVCAREDELSETLRSLQKDAGLVPAPLDCWLVRRGLFTLACRMRNHCDNALELAQALAAHAEVSHVHYPGLPSDPGHAAASRQMDAFGGMLSFIVDGGRARAFDVCARLRLVTAATSLGGPETLIEHRASIEGPATQAPEGLLRLSVGLEDPADLLTDLDQALRSTSS